MNAIFRRAHEFTLRWAAASVAAHDGEFFVGAVRFTYAAMVAPTYAAETLALERAWMCEERMRGDVSELETA